MTAVRRTHVILNAAERPTVILNERSEVKDLPADPTLPCRGASGNFCVYGRTWNNVSGTSFDR